MVPTNQPRDNGVISSVLPRSTNPNLDFCQDSEACNSTLVQLSLLIFVPFVVDCWPSPSSHFALTVLVDHLRVSKEEGAL